ncbi:uncharacterized protein [Drosophila kikkawai]|uniref:Uncharacterized protein n=1 Tax=Drosophila kikkawai TaxID=30033 RepID=A0A6P4I7S0_DROKI|nr:uncharacterized protein LOC108072978 [Drosophila kikkawai]
MSIILDVVQQYVLEKACDLTCEAALTVLRIWTGPKLKEKGEQDKPKLWQAKKPVIVAVPEPEPEPVALLPAQPSCQKLTRALKRLERDVPRFNSGSIDPPQCSCMRLCRDSYFS